MPIFKRRQELGRGDLSIYLKNRAGSPVNAAVITYDIYDFTTGTEVLLPPRGRTPINPAIGEYYANFTVPLDASLGRMRIRFNFRQYLNSQMAEVVQEFDIVDNPTQVVALCGVTPIEIDLLRGLRIMLRDSRPDSDYHFSPPAGEESINQFTRVFGYMWRDEELLEFLRVANDAMNMYPPQTFYDTLDQLIGQHRNWRSLLFQGAMIHAITAMALNWTVDEFNYSIGGISLTIEKASKYQSLASDIQGRWDNQIEQAKATVKVIRGLKQSKYGTGVRSSFGPSVGRGSLTPKRFSGI